MKKSLLLILACLVSAATFAQPRRAITPLKAPTKADLITEQPSGELRNYTRAGGATYATLFFLPDERQEGMSTELVYADDGKTVYIKNIISHAATGTWVKGTIEGDKLLVPYGQLVYWWDAEKDESTGAMLPAYGMQLAEVRVNGTSSNYTTTSEGNAVFTIDGDRLILEGTSGDPANVTFVGLGLTYTNDYDGEWSYYLDYETVFTLVADKPVTPPEGLVTEQYAMTNGIYGHLMKVGFEGNDVYMQGISEDYLPEAWVKGSFISDTKVYFPMQMAGRYSTYLLYFCGTDLNFRNPYYGGTYDFVWNDNEKGITFDYDPEARSFTTERGIVVNNSVDSLDRYERFSKPSIRPWAEKPAKPMAPAILECNDTYFESYGISTLSVSIPCLDEDGNYLNPQKLWYRLYVDDDEPFLLYQDTYTGLPYDGVDEIPYLFTNNRDIFPKSYGMYLREGGFERIGIQSIYYGGDERQETDIYYTLPVSVGIEAVQDSESKAQNKVFDLSGRRFSSSSALPKGIYIKNGKKFIVK